MGAYHTLATDLANNTANGAYLPLDEPSGSTAADDSGNAHDLTYVNSPPLGQTSIIPYETSTCVTVQNSGERYLGIADAAWQGGGSWSGAVWVHFTANAGAVGCGIIAKYHPTQKKFRFIRNSSQNLVVEATHTDNTDTQCVSPGTLALNTTYLVGFTIEAGVRLAVFVNGAKVQETSWTGKSLRAGTQSLNVGRFNSSTTGNTASTIPTGRHQGLLLLPGVALSDADHAALYAAGTTPPAPGVPSALAADPSTESLAFTWAAPASGGTPTGYRVRIDGGAATDVGLTLSHLFTGLSPGTTYTLEVQAYNADGDSAWASLEATTSTEAGWYRVALTLGGMSWDVTAGEAAEYGPRLPLTLGWGADDSAEWPSWVDFTTLTFSVLVADPAEMRDVARGTEVAFQMWTDPAPGADPWQEFTGMVIQVDADTSPDAGVLFTLNCGDEMSKTLDLYVGHLDDWPQESIADRLNRIIDEAKLAPVGHTAEGTQGILPSRSQGAAMSLYQALRATLADAGHRDDSEGVDIYGRFTATHDPDAETVTITPFLRRGIRWPGELTEGSAGWTVGPAAGEIGALQGEYAPRRPTRWAKLGRDLYQWVLVDGTTFGDPDVGIPLVRSTSLVDTSPSNPSAETRDYLGESLMPDGSDGTESWRGDVLRYNTWQDPAPLTMVPSWAPPLLLQPVVCGPVEAAYQVSGLDFITGTIAGARLVLPPGGLHYVDIRLRPMLLGGETAVPVHLGLTWTELAAAMASDDWTTWDPHLTWYDLRPVGG